VHSVDEGKSWLRANWKTLVALVLIFGLAFFLRLYFVYGLAFTDFPWTCGNGVTLPVSGGSDSYYWHRSLCYSFETGNDLVRDDLINYPLGMYNPRPPTFPWLTLITGRALAFVFENAWASVTFIFLLSTGLFGALTVFPTYLLAKEAFGRRAGLVAALLLAISTAHLQRSQSTDADHDAFTLFFVVTTFYFFIRGLKSLQSRRYVENFARWGSITAGLSAFFKENRAAVLYAALAGLCVTVVALSWQGWAYVAIILLAYFVVQLFIDRIRNRDPMGVTVLFTVAAILPLVLALPWYLGHLQWRVWFDVPAYLFGIAFVLGIVFSVTRDYPWTLVIPSVLVAGAVAVGVAVLVNPGLVQAFVSGAGYFIQTKVYETIAEAQAPDVSQVMLAFGWFTFFLSIGGVGYLLVQLPRHQDASYSLIAVWAAVSIFMTMSAGRFIFNGAPAFAVAAAFALEEFVRWADFGGLRRTYRSLADGSWRNAVRKSVKLRHVLVVLALAGLILLPNAWYATDAAIPYNTKRYYDQQVYNSLPAFLRAPNYGQLTQGGATFYFGAFGYSIPESTQYFPAAWQWFSTQDADVPLPDRPAFLSWWDYGFEAVDRGQHPTVADNFQNGVPFAAQFITAQDESQAVALLSIRLIEGDFTAHGRSFSPAVANALADFGLPPSEVLGAMQQPALLIPVIQANPQVYGLWDSEMSAANAMYIFLAHMFASSLNLDELAQLYHRIRRDTATDIGYFLVDTRLFPASAANTGIFYAPAKLADRRVAETSVGQVIPVDFYQILAQTALGSIPIQDVPTGQQISSTEIRYQRMFYESMFYRTYIGYTPTELNLSGDAAQGIPGFASSMIQYPPDPSWMLSHFRVVYRTAYYNPFTDAQNHTDAWRAVNYPDALRLQADIAAGRATGAVDTSSQAAVRNGLVIVRYYDGALVNGTVRSGGRPLAGIRITVQDEFGTPHYVTTTDPSGRYSAVVPFGNITLTASGGSVVATTQLGSTVLAKVSMTVSLAQALREPADLDGDGRPDWILRADMEVAGRAVGGTAYFDLNRNGVLDASDETIPEARIELSHATIPLSVSATSNREGAFSFGYLPDGTYAVRANISERDIRLANAVIGPSSTDPLNLAVPFARVFGYTQQSDGGRVGGATVVIRDEGVGTVTTATAAADGFYAFEPVLAGNFTVSAALDDLAALPAWIRTTEGDRWLNLTLLPSGRVTGSTWVFGTPRPFASLEFQSAADPGLVRIVPSDATGTFAVTLPTGDWNVNGRLYQGSDLYAFLGRVAVRPGATTPLTATFTQGARLDGTVREANRTTGVSGAQVVFLAPSGAWWSLRSGFFGQYLAFLPTGTYAVQASTSTSAFNGSLVLTGSRTYDITLAPAESITGVVYRDADGNGLSDAGEGVPGARIDLVDDRGQRILAVTNASGIFVLLGFPGHTYAGSISALGYETRAIPTSTLEGLRQASPFALEPIRVGVSGTVLLDGSPLVNRPIRIAALALGSGAVGSSATSDTSGAYYLPLVPGAYELVIGENVSGSADRRYENLGPYPVTVPIASLGLSADLAVVERVLVRGNTTANGTAVAARVTFRGPDLREVGSNATSGFEIYLRMGAYSVYANRSAAGVEEVFLNAVPIGGPQTLSLPLVRGARVAGQAQYASAPVPGPMAVTFELQGGGTRVADTTANGDYTVDLPPGAYSVRLNGTGEAVEAGSRQYYRYTFDGSLTVPSNVSSVAYDLDLDRTFDNTTLAGIVTFGGARADAALMFMARGGGAINATAAAASDGTYAVGLQPGDYDMYAVWPAGPAAFLESLEVPHAATMRLDVALLPGYILSGTVTDAQGARTRASVTIGTAPQIERATDAAGNYQVILPSGSYAVTATRVGSENGVAVEYRATDSVDLLTDRVVNLRVEKVVRRSVALTWDPAQRQTIPAGGSVTYAIVVENTGNVPDTYTFSGLPAGWSFRFVPSSAGLNFGSAGNRATVSATITAPPDALVEHGALTILGTSSDGSTTGRVNIEIGILRYRGLRIQANASSGAYDGRFLNYTIEVRNSGNAAEDVTISITNTGNLAAIGWGANLGTETVAPSGSEITLGIAANSTAHVRLELRPARGPTSAAIALRVASQDAAAVTDTTVFTASLPALASTGIGATGPSVVSTPSLPWQYIAIAAAGIAAVLVGLFLTRRRRR